MADGYCLNCEKHLRKILELETQRNLLSLRCDKPHAKPQDCSQCKMYDSEIAKAWKLTSELQERSDKNYMELVAARVEIDKLKATIRGVEIDKLKAKGTSAVKLFSFPSFDILVKNRD